MKIQSIILGLIISSAGIAQTSTNESNIDSAKILLHEYGGCFGPIHKFIELKYSKNNSTCIYKHLNFYGISKQNLDSKQFMLELTQFNINNLDSCLEDSIIAITGSGLGSISVLLWSRNKVIAKEINYGTPFSCISGELADFRKWIFEFIYDNPNKLTFKELAEIYEENPIFIQNYSAIREISREISNISDTNQIESMLNYLVDSSRTELNRFILISFAHHLNMKNEKIVNVVNGLIESTSPTDSESYFMVYSLRNQDNTPQKIKTLKLAYNKFIDYNTRYEAASQLATNKIAIGEKTLIEGLREKKVEEYIAIKHLIQISDNNIIDELIDIYFSAKTDSTLSKYSSRIDYLIIGLNATLSPNEKSSENILDYNYENREENMMAVEEKIRRYKNKK